MLVYVEKIDPEDGMFDSEFFSVKVIFSEESKDEDSPGDSADIKVYLKKSESMTLPQIIDAAIDRARDFLSRAATVLPTEYRRKPSSE